MRVLIVGAGPAGLYLAYLLARRGSGLDIRIVEQNPPDATFGFGVVFSDRALEFLDADDPETHAAIAPHLETWHDISVVHRGETVRIDGIGFAAIGRLKLLRLLQDRVRSVGIVPSYERTLDSLDGCDDVDLIVGADGVNSLVRGTHAHEFGATLTYLTNRFAWFGTTKPFDTLTQTFRHTELGCFNAHHYRHAPDMSTFVVETDAATFARAGFDRMSEDDTKALCEQVFADTLGGHPLVSNRSVWRQFPQVRNARWSHRNRVLLGDALHTAHFSIGSGTRLAMEDALALDKALAAHPADIPAALAAFEVARRPILEKLVVAADASGAWYENFASHMAQEPIDFAMSYITRSGRVSIERLRAVSPAFVARYERERPAMKYA
jgi:2-polyprenyl-6-methoxyphenol hydroxylase-like FAD-dependent oxidoreductase